MNWLCAKFKYSSSLDFKNNSVSTSNIFINAIPHNCEKLVLYQFDIMEVEALLPCPLCNLPHFKDVHTLRSKLINVATTQLRCPVCKEYIMGLDKLTIHLFSHMNENLLEKNEEVIQIPQIQVDTNELQQLNKSQSASRELDLVCDICNFTFTDRTILELHEKLLHHSNPDKNTGASSFHCHLCSKTFKMRGSLIVHLRVAHYGFSSDNSKLRKTPNISSQVYKNVEEGSWEHSNFSLPKVIDNKQWECDVCSKMFTTKYFLKKHKRLHTGEMPYTCTQCNKSFTFQQSYHKHMLYHSSEKPHTCNECGRSFKELSTLQNHIRIHSGERPFACETCGKRFRQRVSYLVHRRIHTGVMPYDCKTCGKKFRYKVSQRSHKCVPENSVANGDDNEDKSPNMSSVCLINNDNIPMKDIRCVLSVDHDGRVSFIRKNDDLEEKEGEKVRLNVDSSQELMSNIYSKNDGNENHTFGTINSSPDLYSMILSPLLPEVESLCLSNSTETSTAQHESNCQSTNNTNRNLFSNTNFLQRDWHE
ncbi:hypothetical protein HHI36_004330 [Cryptolaemus montrouzieri]|uniref:C2H2-type domain-containing protein n=1 Tax=Cryptolaemus montrouzieri TaxID=559131 RepID=A0ABD2NQU6_9CUCU